MLKLSFITIIVKFPLKNSPLTDFQLAMQRNISANLHIAHAEPAAKLFYFQPLRLKIIFIFLLKMF